MAVDPEETFKVTDRRRRPDAEEARPAEEPSATGHVYRESPSRDRHAAASEQSRERTLGGLFVMLASSVAFALGEVSDPATGQAHQDLDQAAELIDLLVLLREKTEGNRTAEETRILGDLIYDLQLRYVSATRSRARPGPSRS